MADQERPDPPDPGHQEPDPSAQPAEEHLATGLDLARSIARGLAGRTSPRGGGGSGGGGRRGTGPTRGRRGAGASGAHPDDRDPQTLDTTVDRFVSDQGWETELRVHGVFSRWEAIVGREVGRHVQPESFADGRLLVRTDSTAWATQMKLLAADVVRRLNEVLGEDTVRVIDVAGPRAPSWKRGRLRVKGRGPRDTYG